MEFSAQQEFTKLWAVTRDLTHRHHARSGWANTSASSSTMSTKCSRSTCQKTALTSRPTSGSSVSAKACCSPTEKYGKATGRQFSLHSTPTSSDRSKHCSTKVQSRWWRNSKAVQKVLNLTCTTWCCKWHSTIFWWQLVSLKAPTKNSVTDIWVSLKSNLTVGCK